MTNSTLPNSVFPPRFQILSGSVLKLIAIVTMFIDHLAAIVLTHSPAANVPLFMIGNRSYTWYRICRDIGRAAFPIFCFLLVEGFLHTRNRLKYGLNLFIFACISEIPWDLWHSGALTGPKQNVFFTLFFGYAAFCALDTFRKKQILQVISVLCLFFVTTHFNADYGWRGYVFLLIMYWLRNEKAAQAIIGSSWLYYEWKACFAFLSINMYNGQRGFIKGKFAKYFFYVFYPLHILILLFVCKILFFS